MLKKETFVNALLNIKKQSERVDKFSSAIEAMSDGFIVFDSDNLYLSSLIKVLREVMNDKDDFISWWLYEDVEKVIWLDDGTRIELNTAEDLYDYLLNYMQL